MGTPVAANLSYCASGGVFGKVVVDFRHRPFYGVHHLQKTKPASVDDLNVKPHTGKVWDTEPLPDPGALSCKDV